MGNGYAYRSIDHRKAINYMSKIYRFPDSTKDFSLLLSRIIAGWRLLAGTWPFVMQKESIGNVQDYFIKMRVPAAEISAYISVYAQFISGLLFIIGLWMRPAALAMLINFIMAIAIVHLHDKIERSFQAWALLAFAILFLFTGAGKISIDQRISK